MDLTKNPNYFFQERPYKSKYICCDCRKSFKRKVASDIKALDEENEPAKCPDCGNITNWIGPKFRVPKSSNIKAWESIRVLSEIGVLGFIGFASNNIDIPEGNKALNILLNNMKKSCELNIERWLRADYAKGNSQQIKYLSEVVKRIDKQMNSNS